MDETKTELVKVYDFITRETTTIPASELTAGMVASRSMAAMRSFGRTAHN
jgi:hypothetical protein